MKTLIREKTGQVYFQGNGAWTDDAASATGFPNLMSAIEAKQQFNLRQVEVVFLMGDRPSAQCDVVLPLTDF
jgi:hypothetical protein